MIKKQTYLKNNKIANNLMSYIFDNIETDINLDYLAHEFNISKFYLHRIFKEQIGTTIYQTIKNIRLQKASNILLTNKKSTITEISNMCGYSSQISFIRAFKQRFNQTPKYWRNGGYKEFSKELLKNIDIDKSQKSYEALKQGLVKVKPRSAYYLRQKGFTKDYKNIWEKISAWRYTNRIQEYEQIGIYHDNPTITPLKDCDYVACIVPLNKNNIDTNLPILEIQECLCISFEVEASHYEILRIIQWVYHEWLPNSGYEKTTIPTYMIYKSDNLTKKESLIQGTLHVPVQYI